MRSNLLILKQYNVRIPITFLYLCGHGLMLHGTLGSVSSLRPLGRSACRGLERTLQRSCEADLVGLV